MNPREIEAATPVETDSSRRVLLASLGASVAAIAAATLSTSPARAQRVGSGSRGFKTTPQEAASSTVQVGPGETMDAATAPTPGAPGDLEILNFALGLERLELDFYNRAIAANDATKYLRGRLFEVLAPIRDHEAAHIQALEAAIAGAGGTAVGPAARYEYPREVFISPIAFARYAFTLEEIGVGAYLGASGAIKSNALRRAAASIYGVETRHAAVWRHLGGHNFSIRYYEGPLSVAQVQGLIAPIVT